MNIINIVIFNNILWWDNLYEQEHGDHFPVANFFLNQIPVTVILVFCIVSQAISSDDA